MKSYQHAFAAHPWATLSATNGSLNVLADSLAQTFERRKAMRDGVGQPWDWARSGRFLAFGVGMAPLLAEWNRWIEFRFPLRSIHGHVQLGALLRRVAVDQIGLCVRRGGVLTAVRRSVSRCSSVAWA